MIQRQPLIVPFTKMNGAGNDFVVLDNRFLRFSEAEQEAIARRVCPRRTGVGADGFLALDPPEASGADGAASGATDFRMRYRNADGALATMCGNGARCLARFAARAGLGRQTPEGTHLSFMTDGGRYTALVTPEPSGPDAPPVSVRLDVPPPREFAASGAASDLGEVHRIWTGTEHAVVFVPDADAAPVAEEGERLRHAPEFAPQGTNVNFVQLSPKAASGEGSASDVRASRAPEARLAFARARSRKASRGKRWPAGPAPSRRRSSRGSRAASTQTTSTWKCPAARSASASASSTATCAPSRSADQPSSSTTAHWNGGAPTRDKGIRDGGMRGSPEASGGTRQPSAHPSMPPPPIPP